MEKDRIEKEDGVKINWKLFGANDVSQQMNALQAALAQGVDGVDLVPWRGEAFTQILTELRSKNIPVVVHNAYVPNAPEVFVAFDNVRAGEVAGQAAVDALDKSRGTDWRQQEGVFIELRCIITASFDIGRDKGYHNIIDPIIEASGGKIKVETREAGCDDSKGRQAADDITSRYGPEKILGVLSIDGDMGFGAASAFRTRGMVKPVGDPAFIPVVTVDASAAELQGIAAGEILTAAEQPATAEGIVVERLLYEMMKNGTVTPASASGTTFDLPDQAGAPWQPVEIIQSDAFQGPWYKTQAFDAASIPADDHAHWANQLTNAMEGTWPTYGAPAASTAP